jgi:quercetin dioxygenase-like cupin family protein
MRHACVCRHNGSEEYVYVTAGSGEVTVLLPGKATKETFALKAGDFHFLPG